MTITCKMDSARFASAQNCIDAPAVMPGERVPADDHKFLEHLQAVSQVAHPRALVVRPAHGNFLDPESTLKGDKENLRVEAPALDGLELKDSLRRGAGKRLEAALRIGEWKPHHHAANRVEAAAKKLSIQRLTMGLTAVGEPPRANGNVGATGDSGEQALCLDDRRGQIGIGEHHDVAQRVQNAIADGVALAAIAWIFEQPEFRRFTGNIENQLRG